MTRCLYGITSTSSTRSIASEHRPVDETGEAPRDGVTRREFLAAVVAVAAVPLASTVACAGEPAVEAPALVGLQRKGGRPIAGGYVNDGSEAGHGIRDRKAPPAPRAATERR